MISDSNWLAAADLLRKGIDKLGVTVSDDQQKLLIQYLYLLEKWSKAYNLTSITDWRGMVIKHLLDSLSINPWVKGPELLDVGTGAGIPGMPLAIINPDKQFTLLDTNGKKTRFMTQVKTELQIANVTVVKSRIETFQPEQPFDQIICRAYSSLENFVKQVQHIGQPQRSTELLAMKGQLPVAEIDALKTDVATSRSDGDSDADSTGENKQTFQALSVEVLAVEELKVPFLDEQRHLIRIQTFMNN